MEQKEKIWIIGKYSLSDSLESRKDVEYHFVEDAQELFQKLSADERISFLASEFIKQKLDLELGERVIASAILPERKDLIPICIDSLVQDIRLDHELEVLESIAWSNVGELSEVDLNFLGRAILEIFECRDHVAIRNSLLTSCRDLASVDNIYLAVDPPYASSVILDNCHLAVPVQYEEKLLAHIYLKFTEHTPLEQQEKVGDALLVLSEGVALAMLRNLAIEDTERTKILWEASFDAIEDPVVLLDENFYVSRANHAYVMLMDTPIKNVIGKESILFPKEEISPYISFESGEWEIDYKDRSYRIYMYRIQDAYGKTKIVLRMQDSTQEKDLTERILAKEQVAEMGILVGSVAHEINNPIGGILSYCQMMLSDLTEEHPLYEDVQEIADAANKCRKIIETMLSLVRQSRGDKQSVLMIDCVESAVDLLLPEAKRLQIKMDTDYGSGLSAFVRGNKNQLLQSIFHLLYKSLLAVELRMQEDNIKGQIHVKLQHKDKIHVVIEDNGNSAKHEMESNSVAHNVAKMLLEEHEADVSFSQSEGLNQQLISFPVPLYE